MSYSIENADEGPTTAVLPEPGSNIAGRTRVVVLPAGIDNEGTMSWGLSNNMAIAAYLLDISCTSDRRVVDPKYALFCGGTSRHADRNPARDAGIIPAVAMKEDMQRRLKRRQVKFHTDTESSSVVESVRNATSLLPPGTEGVCFVGQPDQIAIAKFLAKRLMAGMEVFTVSVPDSGSGKLARTRSFAQLAALGVASIRGGDTVENYMHMTSSAFVSRVARTLDSARYK